jgi:NAD(P)-dependent dehydrogenase (short-subunit alcohol dehydrogenase family)
MKVVVITGATRGIGLGLAEAFLSSGCAVALSGRSRELVEQTAASLAEKYGSEHVTGFICDVTQPEQVQDLWQAAVEHFGRVDIWINNAGMSNMLMNFWEQQPAEMEEVVTTNLLGAMYGSRVALRGMLAQGFGAIYNMEGLGSRGQKVKGLTLYGTTKAAIRYFNEALMQEAADTAVIIGSLSPGMVATRMMTGQYAGKPEELERFRKIFNILGDKVEQVAPWLVQQILANTKNGAQIRWMKPWTAPLRFLTAPFNKRELI